MRTERLTAFSDGVIAVIITVTVLDLKPPERFDWGALTELTPKFLGYVLSFVYVAIYWNAHHHFFQLVGRVTGGILWANLHLLFWLSLIPFATSWLGNHNEAALPTATYGAVLLLCAVAWYVLQLAIIRDQGPHSPLNRALGGDFKGKIAPVLYCAGMVVAFLNTWVADGLYAAVALMWLIPDRRIEGAVHRA